MTVHALSEFPTPRQNRLLGALRRPEYDRLFPHLKHVQTPLGKVLYESGGELQHVYFPTTSVVSLLYVMKNGESAEIAIAGNEGLVGIALIMGGETTPSRAVVQCAGEAYRVRVSPLKLEFERGGSMQHLMLLYLQALITQMVQTAACNRHHSVEQQFCRWLLLSIDRLPSNHLAMTEGLIANMLGIRHKGVKSVAALLQDRGLISYDRGRITVLDRPGLEAHACECYAVVKKELLRLLPQKIAS